MRILLAEDNNNFAYVLKRELEDNSFIVDMVSNGVDAILQFLEREYQFILLDIKMPRLHGLDTLMILKSIMITCSVNPEVQVITFSGENNQFQKISMSLGAVKFLKKPFDIEALIHLLLGLSRLSSSPGNQMDYPYLKGDHGNEVRS